MAKLNGKIARKGSCCKNDDVNDRDWKQLIFLSAHHLARLGVSSRDLKIMQTLNTRTEKERKMDGKASEAGKVGSEWIYLISGTGLELSLCTTDIFAHVEKEKSFNCDKGIDQVKLFP